MPTMASGPFATVVTQRIRTVPRGSVPAELGRKRIGHSLEHRASLGLVVSVETVDGDDERRVSLDVIVHIGVEAGDRSTMAASARPGYDTLAILRGGSYERLTIHARSLCLRPQKAARTQDAHILTAVGET